MAILFVTILRATSEVDRSNVKLAMVKKVLTLVVTVPPLSLGGRDAHSDRIKTTFLWFRSMPFTKKLSLSISTCQLSIRMNCRSEDC